MSGIAGIVNLDGAPVDHGVLRRLGECLAYRGPDALAIWSDGAVGFAHALLRTKAESAPALQPASLDGQVWITADARVDGREELTGKLAARGVGVNSLRTATDAELILHVYAVWGEECLEHLLGEFAFAIWDGRRRRLWCARDHFGVKLFYYAHAGASLIFSNTLEGVQAHPQISDQLNDLAIADFLLFGYNQDLATTSFTAIRRLPPAHTLEWSQGMLRTRRYWTLPVDEVIRYRRAGEYVEHFRALLRAAVTDRLPDARAGVLMSGGLDSTSVAAVARQVLAERGQPFDLRAYTVDYRPLIADEEGNYAQLAAEALGLPVQLLSGADCAPYERWDEPELRKPEPLHEPLAALQYDQLRQVAAHSRVALSGDGGDAILHGQSWPYLVGLARQRKFGRLITEVGGYILSHGRIPPPLAGFRTRLRRWLGQQEEKPPCPDWLNSDLERHLGLRERWEEVNRPSAQIHPVRPAAYATLTGPLWPAIFESQDPGVTRVPVEISAPLFDLRLVRFALALPPVPWGVDKELLRVAMRGVLPEAVRRRPKMPLAGDPLAALCRRKGWRGPEESTPAPALSRYVDLNRLPKVTGSESTEALWVGSRYLSLNYWLHFGSAFKYKLHPEEQREAGIPGAHEETVSSPPAYGVREYS